MANKGIFASAARAGVATDTVNEAGGVAYSMDAAHALAQLAVSGCLNQTYYVTAEDQLKKVLELARKVPPLTLAKTAIYAREKAWMKDMPALLLACLAARKDDEARALLAKVWPRIITNMKMLRNFVQIVRSGQTGRKSFGSAPKRLIRNWLGELDHDELFRASVGSDPSLADIIRMVHPKPKAKLREKLYAHLIGKEVPARELPTLARRFETWKSKRKGVPPDVPFEMLTGLELSLADWQHIVTQATWTQTRMNLNTFARHGVFADARYVAMVADRLRDRDLVRKARAFPHQLLAAYLHTGEDVPAPIRDALHDALELAVENVVSLGEIVYVFPDVSGSMQSPITGHRKGATTVMRCIDVAGLIASTILRRSDKAAIIPFAEDVRMKRLERRDTIMTNAQRLAKLGGGGTNCSAPLEYLNHHQAVGDLCIFVSDNESWIDTTRDAWGAFSGHLQRRTQTLNQWDAYKARNPKAKLVCIDLTPNTTTQAPNRTDILNVGGFNDQVFEVIKAFVEGDGVKESWTRVIEAVTL